MSTTARKRHILAKLRGSAGYTLTEALVTVLLVLLVTSAMATGVAFAVRQYENSVTTSEAKVLQSTLDNVVSNELAITNYAEVGSKKADGSYPVERFFSRHYAVNEDYCAFKVIDDDGNGYGELALGSGDNWKRLVSSTSYAHGMGANITVSYFEKAAGGSMPAHFKVKISIGDKAGAEISTATFDVVPLNEVDVRFA